MPAPISSITPAKSYPKPEGTLTPNIAATLTYTAPGQTFMGADTTRGGWYRSIHALIPVLGYADDAIIVTAVLRSVVRRVGVGAVRAHWPGTDDGFAVLARLTGLSGAAPS